jgi:hypothetical protein
MARSDTDDLSAGPFFTLERSMNGGPIHAGLFGIRHRPARARYLGPEKLHDTIFIKHDHVSDAPQSARGEAII